MWKWLIVQWNVIICHSNLSKHKLSVLTFCTTWMGHGSGLVWVWFFFFPMLDVLWGSGVVLTCRHSFLRLGMISVGHTHLNGMRFLQCYRCVWQALSLCFSMSACLLLLSRGMLDYCSFMFRFLSCRLRWWWKTFAFVCTWVLSVTCD